MKKHLSQIHPLFLLLLATIVGVLAADFFETFWKIQFRMVYVSILSAIFIMFVGSGIAKKFNSIRNNHYFGVAFCLLIAFLSFFNASLLQEKDQIHHFFSHFSSFQKIELIEPLQENTKSYKAMVNVNFVCDSHQKIQACKGKSLVYFKKDSVFSTLEVGDELWVKTNFKEISNGDFTDFDYKKFLSRKQVYHQAYLNADAVLKIEKSKSSSLLVSSHKFRFYLLENIKKCGMTKESENLASALLLGQMSNLDEDLKGAYRSAGVVHILCVSGLHLGVFVWCILQLLFFLQRKKSLIAIKIGIILLCIWGYAFVTGLSPSVLRAATMFSFVFIGQCMERDVKVEHSLIVSALLLIWISPNILFSIGFQLSYLAIVGIVYVKPLLDKIFKPQSKIFYYIWSLLTVSLSAQLLTFPLVLYYFHQFPTYFLFSNLIATPISAILIPLGFVILAFSFLSLFLAKFLSVIFSFLAEILDNAVLFIQKLPHSVLDLTSVTLWGSLCIYLFMSFVILSLKKRRKLYVYSSLISLWVLILIF